MHGCRTSFGTWCAEVDHTACEVAEAALVHTIGIEASQAHNRTTMTERRRPVRKGGVATLRRQRSRAQAGAA